MNADSIPFLQRELARYRTQDLSRIIIDFRNNGGGGDTTWQSLYAAILPVPVSYPLKISANKGFGKEKETGISWAWGLRRWCSHCRIQSCPTALRLRWKPPAQPTRRTLCTTRLK
ncbi:hypothetical protein [Chitinophaga sp. YIM B06452]|uniref:hypothetical protein n=1 Tax=Chitinophaga sp. YIM B06452 TaxID=3082158 RepID=UPI0031FE630D